MTKPSMRAGICLVRLEEQGDRLIITLLTNLDVRTGAQTRQSFLDVDEVLAHVRAFIETFRAASPSPDTTA